MPQHFPSYAKVEVCPQETVGTLYVGDYLPDTIPFAATNDATTIEVYFCDWEVAYNLTNSGTLGCQSANLVTAGQATAYANILSNP